MADLHLREAYWLLLGLLPLLLWPLSLWLARRKMARLVDPALQPWVLVRQKADGNTARILILTLAWALICLALAGPRTPQWLPPQARAEATELTVLLDLSASMNAHDNHPSRRQNAVLQLRRLVSQLPDDMTLGISIFAGEPHELLAPTSDRHLINHHLDALDGIHAPVMGNNLADAITQHKGTKAHSGKQRWILLFTDGDMEPAEKARAEMALSELNARLLIIGMGGDEPTALASPIDTESTILSRRDSAWLRQMASVADGDYLGVETLDEITLAEHTRSTPQLSDDQLASIIWNEWFALPLLGGIVLLMMGLGGPRLPTAFTATSTAAAAMLALLVPLTGQSDTATTSLEAERDRLRETPGFEARYQEGTVCYRLKDYPCARAAFAAAAWQAPDDQHRGLAAFNLANSHFQLGEYEEAAVLYEDAERLGVDPKHTQHNLAYAEDLIAAVRERLADWEETQRRATWRSNAGELPEELADRVAEGRSFAGKRETPESVSITQNTRDALIRRGLERHSGGTIDGPNTVAWVSTDKAGQRETAVLLNRLLAFEAGFASVQPGGRRVEGKRPW